jgi:hypothetical protein
MLARTRASTVTRHLIDMRSFGNPGNAVGRKTV